MLFQSIDLHPRRPVVARPIPDIHDLYPRSVLALLNVRESDAVPRLHRATCRAITDQSIHLHAVLLHLLQPVCSVIGDVSIGVFFVGKQRSRRVCTCEYGVVVAAHDDILENARGAVRVEQRACARVLSGEAHFGFGLFMLLGGAMIYFVQGISPLS